ncbi:MAG: hypothetical protein NXI32_09205 [bacterium]|nr:hypothetical protein [bacterium]
MNAEHEEERDELLGCIEPIVLAVLLLESLVWILLIFNIWPLMVFAFVASGESPKGSGWWLFGFLVLLVAWPILAIKSYRRPRRLRALVAVILLPIVYVLIGVLFF